MKTKSPPKKSQSKHVIVFDHARVDPSHCLTDGLFRPLKRESLEDKSLRVSYVFKDYILKWVNYCPLSIADQSVFLAIHRLASEKGRFERVGNSHDNPMMLDVRTALKLDLEATNLDCLVLETSTYEIAKVIGISDGGNNLKKIKDSLLKLSCVSLIIYRGKEHKDPFWKANLFSQLAGIDGKIVVGINPMLSRALAGEQSTYVNMREQRDLKSEVSKRLHVWLSSWIRHNESKKVGLDVLAPHVWGDECEQNKLRKRRSYLRNAINEINNLEGWSCVEDKVSGFVTIKRPRLS